MKILYRWVILTLSLVIKQLIQFIEDHNLYNHIKAKTYCNRQMTNVLTFSCQIKNTPLYEC